MFDTLSRCQQRKDNSEHPEYWEPKEQEDDMACGKSKINLDNYGKTLSEGEEYHFHLCSECKHGENPACIETCMAAGKCEWESCGIGEDECLEELSCPNCGEAALCEEASDVETVE